MLYDRVEQTTITTGTGALSLIAPTDASRRSFVQAAGSGARVWYCIETIDGTQYEYGWGIVTAGTPDVMTRNPVLSSNSNALVNFPSGTKRVFCALPASKAIVAKAWVTFAGATGAIIASQNVSAVTRNAAGIYTVAFASALADGGYAGVVTTDLVSGQYGFAPGIINTSRSTASCSVLTPNAAGAGYDFPICDVVIFGN